LYPAFKGVYTPQGGTEKSALFLRVLICCGVVCFIFFVAKAGNEKAAIPAKLVPHKMPLRYLA
jgi:hypothetical protein